MFLSFLMGCALLLTGPLLRIHLIFIFSLSAGDGHCGLMTIGANAAEPNTKHGKMTLGYSVNPWCLYYRQRQISAQMCRVTRKIVQRKWAQHGTTVTSHGKLEGRRNEGKRRSVLLTTVCDYLKFLGWSNGALYWTWHASWEYLRTCQSRAGSFAGLVPGSGQEARRATCLHVFYWYCHVLSSF